MRKILSLFMLAALLSACDKHDPILPGVRTAIFDTSNINIVNQDIIDVPTSVVAIDNDQCPYTQDKNNVVWDGTRKIFSGFSTSHTVAGNQAPVCSGKYVYAGLTTGELVKLNPKNRQIMWIADIYRASNLTGGASMVDIVAPPVPTAKYVYVGGLGDAFCKIESVSGNKKWCIDIGVSVPFVITETYAFVVATDRHLYAVSLRNGDVFWRQSVQDLVAPTYKDGVIFVGKQRFSAINGKIIK